MRRLAVTTVLLLALAGLSGAGPAGAKSPPGFAGCNDSHPRVRPHSILVACGDGNFFLRHMRWSHWTQRSAAGGGTGHQNDCDPDCAHGHFHRYRVAVRLSRPRTCTNGRREFTHFTYAFIGRKPKGVRRRATLKSPFYLGTGCP